MFSISLFKIKLITILTLVFMGVFSRLVLGFPLLLPVSTPTLHSIPYQHHFPESGTRSSLRFMPTARYTQKRRRAFKNGKIFEEETTLLHWVYNDNVSDLIGEFIDSNRGYFHHSLGIALS